MLTGSGGDERKSAASYAVHAKASRGGWISVLNISPVTQRNPMKNTLPFLLIAALAAPLLTAGDAPPPATTPGANAGGDNNNRNNWQRRLIADNPELQGVDLESPEGQEKVRQVMAKRMEAEAPRIRQRMAENQAAARAELNKQFGMNEEEFKAIEPLLARVENLRMQKGLVDRSAGQMGMAMGGRRGGAGGAGGPGGMFNPQLMLGDTPLEPSVKEIQDAVKALKTLIDDAQANANELALAVVRVRKAREAFVAILAKAQEELRAVLSPKQEAILVDRGTLD